MAMRTITLFIQSCPQSEQVGVNPPRLLDMLVLKVSKAILTTVEKKALETKRSLPSSKDKR